MLSRKELIKSIDAVEKELQNEGTIVSLDYEFTEGFIKIAVYCKTPPTIHITLEEYSFAACYEIAGMSPRASLLLLIRNEFNSRSN